MQVFSYVAGGRGGAATGGRVLDVCTLGTCGEAKGVREGG